jgi:hypothetical protein
MAKFKMKQLALALGMVAGSLSLIPSAQAVNVATDDLGQVLIFPYYTTRGGWNTLFNVTNTSNNVVAVKVRFHEAYNSRDVFDFNVILSPNDVWSGWVEYDEAGGARFRTNDNSCTVPQIVPEGAGQTFQGNGANAVLAFTGAAADGGPSAVDRVREGYVTMIAMGMSAPAYTALAANAIHNNVGDNAAVPANCATLRAAFSNPGGIAALRAGFPDYGVNPLKGAFSLVNGANGWNASGETVTLANFRTAPFVTLQLPPSSVAGQVYGDAFHEPDLASANTNGRVLREDGTVIESTATSGADATTFVLQRRTIANQWARRTDPSTGWLTSSDWTVSFPTKRFYVDTATHEFAGRATNVNGIAGNTRFGLPAGIAPFTQAWSGRSCDTVTFTFYDREEFTPTNPTDPVFSPAPTPVANALCLETNVLTFDSSNILSSAIAANVNGMPADNGWMRLTISDTANNGGAGLPVMGFSAITRATSDGVLNEAFLVDHAYIRAATGALTVPGGAQVYP